MEAIEHRVEGLTENDIVKRVAISTQAEKKKKKEKKFLNGYFNYFTPTLGTES